MAQLMFRCLSSQAPSYLSQLFSSTSNSHNTRSSSTYQINLPPVKSSFGQRAFSFSGASLWRSLPPGTRCSSKYSDFTKLCTLFYSNAWMSIITLHITYYITSHNLTNFN
jgi:hypothetical protein